MNCKHGYQRSSCALCGKKPKPLKEAKSTDLLCVCTGCREEYPDGSSGLLCTLCKAPIKMKTEVFLLY